MPKLLKQELGVNFRDSSQMLLQEQKLLDITDECPNFVDNREQTVTDLEVGLTWMQGESPYQFADILVAGKSGAPAIAQ